MRSWPPAAACSPAGCSARRSRPAATRAPAPGPSTASPAPAHVLRTLGAEHILVSTDGDFDAQLAARCRDLGATIAFDAVAGDTTGQLVRALPRGGEVVIYGALSGAPCGAIDPMALAFGDKRVRGFEVAAYLRDVGLLGSIRLANAAQKLVARGLVTTTIRARVPLADAPAALPDYLRSMSDGKLLLVPSASPARLSA